MVEVDSGNMAKLLAGQYVLLNQLYTGDKKQTCFLVVHTYSQYNPERTTNNLALINSELYDGNGIAFGALHIEKLSNNWTNGIDSFLEIFKHTVIPQVHIKNT